jgi:hypothetical protein
MDISDAGSQRRLGDAVASSAIRTLRPSGGFVETLVPFSLAIAETAVP